MAERTRDGLAAARARGRTGGQRPKLSPRQARIAQETYEALGPDGRRAHTVAEIASEFGVSRPTIYRHLQRSGRCRQSIRIGGPATPNDADCGHRMGTHLRIVRIVVVRVEPRRPPGAAGRTGRVGLQG